MRESDCLHILERRWAAELRNSFVTKKSKKISLSTVLIYSGIGTGVSDGGALGQDSAARTVELYERYATRAFRYARALGLSAVDAEDVVAESFLRILRTPSTDQEHTAGLVFTAVHHTALNPRLRNCTLCPFCLTQRRKI